MRRGGAARVGTAPICTLHVGASSSGICRSRTYVASGPRCTRSRSRSTSPSGGVPPSIVTPSMRRTPCPIRSAPQSSSVGDELETGRFARVQGEMGEAVASDRDRVGMVARREAGLGTREVERHDRLVVAAAPHAQLRDLPRARRGAHRADDRAHRDGVARRGCLMLPVAEPASAPRRRPRRATGLAPDAARVRSAPPRIRPRRQQCRARPRARLGATPTRSASRPRCARTLRGTGGCRGCPRHA